MNSWANDIREPCAGRMAVVDVPEGQLRNHGLGDVGATRTQSRLVVRTKASAIPWVLSSETKCNTPADLIIGTADQDLRECCPAMFIRICRMTKENRLV
jgi:hypothetical protein